MPFIILAVFNVSPEWIDNNWYSWLPSIAVFPAAVAFIAYRYGVKRWYLYALWMVLSWFLKIGIARLLGAADFGRWVMYYESLVVGGVILLAGIIVLRRFLRNNPEIVPEELNEQTQNR